MHWSTLDVYLFFLFGSLIPADMFDVVVIVGGLSVGQVPVGVVRELCKSTKPGNTDFYTISTATVTLFLLMCL